MSKWPELTLLASIALWEVILKHLEREGSSRDVLYTSLACTDFQRILEPTKPEWMRLDGSILPFIFPYLKDAELLACRRVCKNWQRGVENFIDDSDPFWNIFNGESAIQAFLQARRQHKMKTPFALRSLSFRDSGERMDSGFWEKALVLLNLYGDETWNLDVEPCLYDPQRFYEILRQALEFTPNLKCLHVYGSYEFFESNEEDHSVRLKKLEEHLEDHPLPKIDSLETLSVNAFENLPVVMYAKIISDINPDNLKYLKIDFESQIVGDVFPIKKPLLSLTDLHVSWISHKQDLDDIFDKISPTAPLENLSLDFGDCLGLIPRKRMWKVINKFKMTLKTLSISGAYDSATDEAWMLSLSGLDTPNLKTLEVKGVKIKVGSLPPSLEHLHHRIDEERLSLDYPKMDFYRNLNDAGKLEYSPIWGEMENLKTMRVYLKLKNGAYEYDHDLFCTRKMHEDVVKNRAQL